MEHVLDILGLVVLRSPLEASWHGGRGGGEANCSSQYGRSLALNTPIAKDPPSPQSCAMQSLKSG